MRHVASLLIVAILLPATALAVSLYSSNELMQVLGELDKAPESGYFIVEDGYTRILYHDGDEIRRITRSDDSITEMDGDGERTVMLKDGLPVGERTSSGVDIAYEYSEDGVLRRVTYSSEGQIQRVVQYLTGPTGALAGFFDLTGDDAVFYSGSMLSYRDGDDVSVVPSDASSAFRNSNAAVLEGDVIRQEDGTSLVLEQNGDEVIESLYDPDLRLVRQRVMHDGSTVSQTDWEYDEEGLLTGMRYQEGDSLIVYGYDGNGAVLEQSEYVSGQLYETRSRQDDGTIRAIRYRNGRQYAMITYDKDGSRVLSLEML